MKPPGNAAGSIDSRARRMLAKGVPVLVVTVALITGALAARAASDARQPLREQFLSLRFGLFLHFGMGTFTEREWATGYEDPGLFNPGKLNCGQWADVARQAGMSYGVLTAKHTGAWCLWDSKYTTHDMTAFRNYAGGRGDVVRQFVNAFRARGLKAGLYYCFPGDFAMHATYGHPVPESRPDLHGLPPEAVGDYAGFIKKQLSELLTAYGPIDILWIDQYRNKYTGARWQEILAHIRSIQPRCIVVANNAASLQESDVLSFELPWNPKRLPEPGNTVASEVSDTIQKNRWFWRPSAPSDLLPVEEIASRLRMANSRSSNYLLNVPPDRDGLISGAHLQRLREVGRLLAPK